MITQLLLGVPMAICWIANSVLPELPFSSHEPNTSELLGHATVANRPHQTLGQQSSLGVSVLPVFTLMRTIVHFDGYDGLLRFGIAEHKTDMLAIDAALTTLPFGRSLFDLQ